ncbi:hypothetical protein ACOI1H_18970 [Loktanella sp. DJP18]|uniref:hypothetical protein n=1 Tax=Loktanella sp. DJP18 TaxID=3409788 RepID=UPI003BB49881
MLKTTRKGLKPKKIRGLSLIEAMLALGLGAIVATSGFKGVTRYSESVKVQASASMLSRLTTAADRYAEDNFKALVTAAPQELPITVLEPYYGLNIGTDAFRTEYKISTRKYSYKVPDGSGGTRNENALQVLLVGEHDAKGPIGTDGTLRASIANTAGGGAGFVSTKDLTCKNDAGTALRSPGQICGSFGNYSFQASTFPATDFDGAPATTLDGVAYVALVTKGDSSVYGDQLYRYDFGDPELNTMHTDLNMANNDIIDPAQITGVNGIQFDGGSQSITTAKGTLFLEPAGTLSLNPGNNTIRIDDDEGSAPIIVGSKSRLQVGSTGDWTSFGPLAKDTITGQSGVRDQNVGTGDVYSDKTYSNVIRTHQINSLHNDPYDALRLQNRANGEVVVGKRIRYAPDGGSGPRYEISDGKITAQMVTVQDVTCADCGGALSNILPKWRHMGTYYVRDKMGIFSSGTRVEMPECSDSRREQIVRNGTGQDGSYKETAADNRYEAKIIITPKQFGFDAGAEIPIVFNFFARRYSGYWMVYPRATSDHPEAPFFDAGVATGLAATYCVFTGGKNSNPVVKRNEQMQKTSGPNWLRLD